MAIEMPSRELRNNTRGLLRQVEAGEDIVITVGGRPVATLTRTTSKPRWVSREEFVGMFADQQADAGLRQDLDELAPDTTDDIPWR